MKEKNLELDRLVFFSDAVVAIALTLLALDLKVEIKSGAQLHFSDIGNVWEKFAAFFLSFIYVTVFWTIHHRMFANFRKINYVILWYNMGWLLFIVMLPFSASLISAHFNDTAAIFIYSVNTLMITFFQNQLVDYTAVRPAFMKEDVEKETIRQFRISCNVAMINALLAVIFSLISPLIAFIILVSRLPMIAVARIIYKPGIQAES